MVHQEVESNLTRVRYIDVHVPYDISLREWYHYSWLNNVGDLRLHVLQCTNKVENITSSIRIWEMQYTWRWPSSNRSSPRSTPQIDHCAATALVSLTLLTNTTIDVRAQQGRVHPGTKLDGWENGHSQSGTPTNRFLAVVKNTTGAKLPISPGTISRRPPQVALIIAWPMVSEFDCPVCHDDMVGNLPFLSISNKPVSFIIVSSEQVPVRCWRYRKKTIVNIRYWNLGITHNHNSQNNLNTNHEPI